jgi:sortase (surface protein transpeptidase)
MNRPGAGRRWWAGVAVALVVAAAAVVALVVWVAGRPGPSAGDGLSALRETSAPPSATPTPTPSVRASARATTSESATAPPPARLRIPALGVDATVRAVGVQRDGAMVIPASPTSVGWYRYGSAPADPVGHTVIAGHVATREDGPGALAALSGAERGMRVEVVDADGTTHRYVVRGRESIRKKALPVDEIFAREGKPLLVLVTCGGEYLPELRSHRDNVVVTATPVS